MRTPSPAPTPEPGTLMRPHRHAPVRALALGLLLAAAGLPGRAAPPAPATPRAQPDLVGFGLYRDGQLIETFGDARVADLSAPAPSSRTLQSRRLQQAASLAAPALSEPSRQRNAALTSAAQAGLDLQRHLSAASGGLAGDPQFRRLAEAFLDSQRTAREALTATRADLVTRGFPDLILERHDATIRHHDESVAAFEKALADASAGQPDAPARLQALLAGTRLAQVPADEPEPTVRADVREAPRLSRAEADALLAASPAAARDARRRPVLAVTRERTSALPAGRARPILAASPPGPADLAATTDIQLNQAITDQAAALGNSPVALYEFVRNQVGFQPYLGSRKGAAFTLNQLNGNDTDQASLLIALLRASGIPARYARGTIELTPEQAMALTGVEHAATAASILTTAGLDGVAIVDGPDVVAVRCTRVWVLAYVPYSNYRGTGSDSAGSAWVPLDPSFKAWNITPGQDVLAAMGWNVDTYLDAYVSVLNPLSPVEQWEANIQTWLNANQPGTTLDDVARVLTLAPQSLGLLPASLPYQVVSQSAELSELESTKRYQVRFRLYDGGTTFIDHTLPVLSLVGHRLTIEYVGATPADQAVITSYGSIYETPPNLVQVKPVLKLDEVPVATGAAGIGMGRTHKSDMHFLQPVGDDNVQPIVSNDITAGNGQAIAFDSFLDTHDLLFGGSNHNRTNYLEELYYESGVDYLGLVDDGQRRAERLMRMVSLQDVSEAIVENSVKVTTSFGTPVTFEWTGLVVDADRRVVGPFHATGDASRKVPYMKLTGYDGSFMEHRIFEANFDSPAVSTIKAFHVSAGQGINLCRISNSIAAQCPGFSHNASVTAAVNNALAQGHVVTIPRTGITYEQWVGTGYIDMDPATGAAGYIISGGISGNIDVSGGAIVDWLWPIFPPCLAWPWNIDVTVLDPSADSPHPSAVFSGCDDTLITFQFEVTADCLFSAPATAIRERTTHLTKKQIADHYGGGDYVLTISSLFSAPVTRKLTIVKPNLTAQGLGEEWQPSPNEEAPGASIPFNGDDDNANNLPDGTEPAAVAGEDDLVPFFLEPGIGSVNSGSLVLAATAGAARIKVYENADRTGPITLPKSWPAGPSTVPEKVYVEGAQGSTAESDIDLQFRYDGAFTCDDHVKATVVQVDLDADTDYDGTINDTDEPLELTKGARVIRNRDDDDNNGQVDDAQTSAVAGENDLRVINLKLNPGALTSGTLRLEAASGAGSIKVWDSATKGTEVTLPKTWTLGTDAVPPSLFVEGIQASTAERDVELVLRFTSGSNSAEDHLKLTVFHLGLALNIENHPKTGGVPVVSQPADITDADEPKEESLGGYLWVNDDNDNGGAGDSVLDKDDNAVYVDNDLEPVKLEVPDFVFGAGYKVEVQISAANVKLWQKNKGNPLAAGLYATKPTLDTDNDGLLYLEGLDSGSATVTFLLKDGANTICQDTVKATVFKVSSVAWVTDGTSLVDNSPGPVPPGQTRTGQRIFPDQHSRTDASTRDRPRVSITLTPAIPADSGWQVPAIGKAFDVDHYSSGNHAGNAFDIPGLSSDPQGHAAGFEPNDNRTGYPAGEAGDAYHIGLEVVDDGGDTVESRSNSSTQVRWAEAISSATAGVGRAILRIVHLTPCNNWRIAAGCAGADTAGDPTWWRINNDPNDGTTLEYINDTALTTGAAAGTPSRSSETLTVWRHLFLEEDRMVATVDFYQSSGSSEDSLQDNDVNSGAGTATLGTDLDAAIANQYENGAAQFWDMNLINPDVFLGVGTVTANGAGTDVSFTFAAATPAATDYVYVTDDDVMNHTVTSGTGGGTARITPAAPDTTLFNQAGMFPAACIEVDTAELNSFDTSNLAFELHSDSTASIGDPDYIDRIQDSKGIFGTSTFWVATALIAYEGGATECFDPITSNALRGISAPYWDAATPSSAYGGFLSYSETIRDWATNGGTPGDSTVLRMRRTTLHECGHVLGGRHSDGGLMTGGTGTDPASGDFSGDSLRRFMLLRDAGP